MVRATVVTTHLAPWHWQDKFEARDPENAHRQQLLQIEKQISFTKWLRAKRVDERRRNERMAAMLAAKRQEAQNDREAKEKERKEHKRRAKAEAQQRREERAQRELADARQREAASAKSKRLRAQRDTVKHAYTDIMRGTPAPKAESTTRGPTFKQWMAQKQRQSLGSTNASSPSAPPRVRPRSEKTTQAAYEAWLERKQLEEIVKHKMAAEAKAQRALDTKRARERAWQKKAVVCAYSKNQSEKEPAWRTVALS